MTIEVDRNVEQCRRRDADSGRRAFVKGFLALGVGLMGTACRSVRPLENPCTSTPDETRGEHGAGASPPLREDRFELQVEGRTVPGILWHPAQSDARTPLVLAGHGGGFGTAGHKRVEPIVALAAELGRYGIATAAIDQPGCGDRPGAEQEQARRRTLTIEQAIDSLWTPALVEEMARDWQGTLDHLVASWGIGTGGIGYWGLSGGTTFGLPLVALEPRITAAVLGLNRAVPLMLAYVNGITCPVLYTLNLDDHFMSREAGLALFDALPSQDKFVLAYPGDHGQNLEPATAEWARFFALHLSAHDASSSARRGARSVIATGAR